MSKEDLKPPSDERKNEAISKLSTLLTTKKLVDKWWFIGLVWGIIMLILLEVLFPLAKGQNITIKKVFLSLPIWLIVGIVFALILNFPLARKSP